MLSLKRNNSRDVILSFFSLIFLLNRHFFLNSPFTTKFHPNLCFCLLHNNIMNIHPSLDKDFSRVQQNVADLSDSSTTLFSSVSFPQTSTPTGFLLSYKDSIYATGDIPYQGDLPPSASDFPDGTPSEINVPLVVGLISGFGTLFFGVLCGVLWFALLGRGRIRLGPGAPGEYDDENQALEQEVAELGAMDNATRQMYLRTKAFITANTPNSANTDISLAQYLSIQEKGVSAWEFEVDFPNANCFVEGRTEIEFYDNSTCCTQTNLPIPKQNDVYYFEAKMFELPTTTLVSVGLTTKPYPTFRLPGYHKFSIAYDSMGERRCNATVNPPFGPKFQQGDVVGVGYKTRTGTVFFTHNGRRVDDTTQGFRYNMFPTLGANGPCKIHVNFGQAGFVYIEANVKKWGLAPAQGTLLPPPAYGDQRDSVLLETGSSYMPTSSSLRTASADTSSSHTLTSQNSPLPPLPPSAATQSPSFSQAAYDRQPSIVSNHSLVRLRSSGSAVTIEEPPSNTSASPYTPSGSGAICHTPVTDAHTPAPEYSEAQGPTPVTPPTTTQDTSSVAPGSPPPGYSFDTESSEESEAQPLIPNNQTQTNDQGSHQEDVSSSTSFRAPEFTTDVDGEASTLMEDYVSRCSQGDIDLDEQDQDNSASNIGNETSSHQDGSSSESQSAELDHSETGSNPEEQDSSDQSQPCTTPQNPATEEPETDTQPASSKPAKPKSKKKNGKRNKSKRR